MAFASVSLKVAMGLLMVDAMLELSFISSMVAWLHRRAGRDFEVSFNGQTYPLHGKPVGLLANQGHTSNGAAGTAFVLIGMGGILALWLRSRSNFRFSSFSKSFYHFWLVMTVLSALLSLSAVIYTFVITKAHSGQTIDQVVASNLNNKPYPHQVPYPLQFWTPENWFAAILELDLVHSADRTNISHHLTIMKGWRWNTIPLFFLGALVSVLAVLDGLARRKEAERRNHEYAAGKRAYI